jgi:hypothetical protein
MHSFKFNQQHATLYNIIIVNSLHVLGGFSAHYAATASGNSMQLDIYPMPCVQFLSF